MAWLGTSTRFFSDPDVPFFLKCLSPTAVAPMLVSLVEDLAKFCMHFTYERLSQLYLGNLTLRNNTLTVQKLHDPVKHVKMATPF